MAKLPDTVNGARALSSRMVAIKKESNPEGRMPLMDHLRELRSRVVKAALAIVIGTTIGLVPWLYDRLWTFIDHPFATASLALCKAQGQVVDSALNGARCAGIDNSLIVNGIFDPLTIRIEIAFFFGLILSSPIWFYQLWAFIAPGLYAKEKRYSYIFVGAAVPLFLAGAALAYWVMNRGLTFLLGLTPHGVTVLPTITTYLGYVTAMILGFGLTFELPLAVVMLNYARILKHSTFRKWRRVMIFAVFVFAGMASPSPDPLTMLLLAGPCVVLVEVAEVIVWAHDRRLARQPSMYEGLSDNQPAPLDDYDDSVDSDH
ncbi:MAG TPA: twin-arginine translocase subunit TatC [Streptosporangiaceae bacterium]|jgi:sec-independent protein translocase protein TatC